MEFEELIKKRHCVRRFDPKKEVSNEQIEKLLKAATLAPSEGNIQPWIFVVVKKQEAKQKLTDAIFGQTAIEKASVIIITCINLNITAEKYSERGISLYSIQSTAAATEHIFLALTDMGLSACWIGAFDEDKVKEILDLKPNLRPVVIMPVGYSAEEAFLTDRKDISKISKIIE